MSPVITRAPARAREFDFTLPIGYTDNEGLTHRSITLRKMTGREESILADRRFQKNGGRLVTELLQSCIVRLGALEKDTAPAIVAMYSADRNYLLIKLRSITFGAEMQASYTCPHCNETVQVTENLDELPVKALGDGESA